MVFSTGTDASEYEGWYLSIETTVGNGGLSAENGSAVDISVSIEFVVSVIKRCSINTGWLGLESRTESIAMQLKLAQATAVLQSQSAKVRPDENDNGQHRSNAGTLLRVKDKQLPFSPTLLSLLYVYADIL